MKETSGVDRALWGREFTHRIRVPYAHVDQMGFVYYANYFVYFEMARSELLREAGIPYPELEQRGILLPVVEAHCRYRRSARYDDLLRLSSGIPSLRGSRIRIEYEVRLEQAGLRAAAIAGAAAEEELLCTGYTEHVCMARDGRVQRPADELRRLAGTPAGDLNHA